MRASLIGAGLFAIVAVGCSGSKGDNLFGPGGTDVTGGGGSGAGDDSSTGSGGSSSTGTGGGLGGGSTGGGGAFTGTGGAGTGGAVGTGGRGAAGAGGTGGSVVAPPDAGSGGTGRPDAAPPQVDAAPDVGGGGTVVACGNEMCTVGVQQCCDTNNPTCIGLNGGGGGVCPANAPRLRCDDGSDCPGAQVCCATQAGGAQNTDLARCTQPAQCGMGSQILCNPADPNACPRQATPTCSVTPQAIFVNRPFCN